MRSARTTSIALVLSATAPLLHVTAARPAAPADIVSNVRADADWLLQAVSSDGGIGTWIDKAWLVPYRSNFAAMGLARATAVTKDARYAAAAWRWLEWYQAHMDASGFVTDYQWRNGRWVSTGDMDSTDAYAATFLSAVLETFHATGDLARLSSLRTGIRKAVDAMAATADDDGLHFAKPGWPFKYVMDEAENYAGLLAAADLAAALGDVALRDRAASDARRLAASFPAFWSAGAGGYDWAMHADGTRSPVVWGELYASAVAQIWVIAFGLVEGPAARTLFARFESAQPNWGRPAQTTQYPWGPGKVDYWPVGGLAAARAGLTERAAAAAASIRSAALAANRYWPFTTAEAGELILLQTVGIPLEPVAPKQVPTRLTPVTAPGVGATLRETISGHPVAGVRLELYSLDAVGGRRSSMICAALTDAAGTVRCAQAAHQVAGAPGYEASFSGTAVYLPSSVRRRFGASS